MWRYQEFLPLDGEPTVGLQVGGTPLVRADRLAAALGVERPLDQERRRQLPDAVVQGPRRRRGPEQGPRVRLHHGRLRLDRQPGQQRRRQRRRRRPGQLHLRARRPGAGQDPRHQRLRRQGHRRQRHLRRGEPPLHAGGVQVRLGLRQHQPAAVLRRGLQDVGLRDRRAARLADAAARRLPDGRRQPDRQDPQGVPGTAQGRPDRRRRRASSTAPRPTGCSPISTTVKNGWETHRPVRKPNTIAKSLAIGDPADGYLRGQGDPRLGRLGRGRERRRRSPRRWRCWAGPKASSPRRPAA